MTRGSGGSLCLSGQRAFTSNLLPAYPGALGVLLFPFYSPFIVGTVLPVHWGSDEPVQMFPTPVCGVLPQIIHAFLLPEGEDAG